MLESEKDSHHYHHGNVKEALIVEALTFITENQAANISLRGLSRQIGITPAAVYNHFSDKDALILAVKVRIYEKFNAFFEARLTNTDDPEQSLLEMCQSYYQFSRQFPSHFQFLFGSVLPMQWSTPEMVEVACRCIVRARKLVLQIYQKYQMTYSEEEVVNTTLLVWSQLHGIVTLRNSGSIQAAVTYQNWPASCALGNDSETEELIRQHIHLMVNGVLNIQRGPANH